MRVLQDFSPLILAVSHALIPGHVFLWQRRECREINCCSADTITSLFMAQPALVNSKRIGSNKSKSVWQMNG
jgi:hypothetical protein